MDPKPGGSEISTREESNLAGTLLWDGRHPYFVLGRSKIVDAVRTLCLDGRSVPRNRDAGPARPIWSAS